MTLSEIKKEILADYQKKFDDGEKEAFELHKAGKHKEEMAVIKKMAGLKLMIDHCKAEGVLKMEAEQVKTYPYMDSEIVGYLKLKGDNISLYAAKRIMELEEQLKSHNHVSRSK